MPPGKLDQFEGNPTARLGRELDRFVLKPALFRGRASFFLSEGLGERQPVFRLLAFELRDRRIVLNFH